MVAAFARGEPLWLVWAAVLFLLLHVLQALRLHVLVRVPGMSFLAMLRLVLVGFFFNNVLPTNVGGDVYKVVGIRRHGPSLREVIPLVLADRVVGLVSIFVLGLPFALTVLSAAEWREAGLLPREIDVPTGPAIVLAFLVAVALLGVEHRWRLLARTWSGARETLRVLGSVPGSVYARIGALSVVIFVCRVVRFHAYAEFFGLDLSIAGIVFVVFVANLVGLVPLSMGGLGIQEGAIAYSLSLLGESLDVGTAMGILNRVLTLALAVVGGGLFLSGRRERVPRPPSDRGRS